MVLGFDSAGGQVFSLLWGFCLWEVGLGLTSRALAIKVVHWASVPSFYSVLLVAVPASGGVVDTA